MINKSRVAQIDFIYRMTADAVQAALGEDDFAALDLINQQAQQILAALATSGWVSDDGLEASRGTFQNGDHDHERT